MRALRLLTVVGGLCTTLLNCAPPAPGTEQPSQAGTTAPLAQVELAPAPRLRSATPSYRQLARVEGYGNPQTGELWIRAVPLVEGFEGFESGGAQPREAQAPEGVGVSEQAIALATARVPGYCDATYAADGVPNDNPNGTLEFYREYDATGNAADAPSFDPAICYGRLDPEYKTPATNAYFTYGTGVGCALQHVGNFTGIDYNRVLLDVDWFNGFLDKHGPYGPPFTTGTVVTPQGRNAPYQDLGLWDFGPMPSGTQGQTTGPHLKNMWIYFMNGDPTPFNWTGYILGEVFEDCGDADDDDCDGVDDNGCGLYTDGADCYANADCASGFCAGADVVSGHGNGGEELIDDKAGTCGPPGVQIDAGGAVACRITGAGVECWGNSASNFEDAPVTGTNHVQLAVGVYHGCTLHTDGTVECWGDDMFNEVTNTPSGVFEQIAANSTHTCALAATGAVTCWGENDFGQSTAPASTDFMAVGAGNDFSCGLRHNGSIKCWGDSSAGRTTPPVDKVYRSLAVGVAHACAIDDDGGVDCWGFNNSGQATAPTGSFVQVAAGTSHTCGLKDDGSLACWGDSANGKTTPPPGTSFLRVTAGYDFSCALKTDGAVLCWGLNDVGQTNAPFIVSVPTPELSTVSSGSYHGCAIMPDSGKVKCWGDSVGSSGAFGGYPNQPLAVNAPDMNLGPSPALHIASGQAHSCTVSATNQVRCWGYNANGQASGTAGANVLSRMSDPTLTALNVGGDALKVVTGLNHTCALRIDARLVCWGQNDAGQIGMNTATNPVALDGAAPVVLDAGVADVCAGDKHTCVRLQNGTVRCWGANALGQLGLSSTANLGDNEAVTSVPAVQVLSAAEVAAGRTVAKLACGASSTCVVLDDGNMRCWGKGTNGTLGYGALANLGDNEHPNSYGYVNVGSGELVSQVTIGDDATCARLQSGGTKCWGHTQQLGATGSCLGHPAGCGTSPVSTPPATTVDFGGGHLAVELGYRSISATLFARLDDGTIKCWHLNNASSVACGTNLSNQTINFANGTPTLPPPLQIADLILGQPGANSTGTGNGAVNMSAPNAVAVDPTTGKVFVADTSNNRVLRFASLAALNTGAAAEAVVGQTAFNLGISGAAADRLSSPGGVVVDSAGRLWVGDSGNNRVLRFDGAATLPNGPSANAVLGQSDFLSNAPVTTASGMNLPVALAIDLAGRLWVTDQYHHRLLRFDDAAAKANGAAADGLLGAATFTVAAPGLSASQMNTPVALVIESTGRLWVADRQNHRVLRFDNAAAKANGASADGVLGQTSFVTATQATTSAGMRFPVGVAMDSSGSLYVSDMQNHRVLIFAPAALGTNGPTAIDLIGAPNFATATPGSTLHKLNLPNHLWIDAADRLWVADRMNNRVTMYMQ